MSRIALTGSHSTGKTTLLNELRKIKIFNNYIFSGSIARDLSDNGLNINECGNDETQLCILLKHYHNALENDIILDRCIIDGYCYTYYLYKNNRVSMNTFKLAELAFNDLIDKYDFIFWLKADFDLVYDGIRSNDINFRNSIEDIFKDVLKNRSNIYILNGSVEDRLNTILNIIRG